MNSKLKNDALLVLTALIWGSAFVAQSVGMDYMGPFTFNSLRCLMGGLVLLPVIWIMGRKDPKDPAYRPDSRSIEEGQKKRGDKKILLTGGLCCGIALAAASSLQQIGLVYTSAGKAGFITALYILIVPVLGLFLGKKVGLKTWIGVGLAIIGMYFLCIKEGFFISYGDFLVMICAFIFSLHILIIDYFSPKVDGVKLSCIQFWVAGILCAVPMIISEKPTFEAVAAAWLPLLYAGVLSCGVAYTLQIIAQKNTDPTVASLILSMESVFAALAGWVLINETLSPKEIFGCVLVFTAIILAQLPQKRPA
ncbi:DMT family transporter [Clostridium sp. AF19-22AC]|jgi:drug/metabolite transporter (DMT)-like permease|uniref:Drug/metabolite transporter (DMT)-like permease n=1 Tax=Faecalicatena orotica TaxID=1544 RepID=A0A2Y9C9N3_9FIRM|nr:MULTISPECIES: DMT family transporter [Clostridia]PWJ31241.1 drug/metabolite transporter (DMT)-like permease [Faecalicatena orotica]RHR26708.1 DMT family transporter [Clostridium sp. AF19-22AC]SSA54447.1 Permease of the drug/metabolite transporter (DMT) superfamily [Faecalicatena orotica]